MKTRDLEILFIFIVGLIAVLLLILLVFAESGDDEPFGGLKEITGTMQTHDVPHEKPSQKIKPEFIDEEDREKFSDKFWEYQDHIEERRDVTFLR